VHVKSQYIIHC